MTIPPRNCKCSMNNDNNWSGACDFCIGYEQCREKAAELLKEAYIKGQIDHQIELEKSAKECAAQFGLEISQGDILIS